MPNSIVWDTIWNRITEDDRSDLMKLLLRGKRIEAIKCSRAMAGLDLLEARDFVDSAWMCQRVTSYDPTRMTAPQEFKAEVLRTVTDMLEYINDSDMSVIEKYQFITDYHIPMLFTLCTED